MPRTSPVVIHALRAFLLMAVIATPAAATNITVFAAASLGEALNDAADAWEEETDTTVTLVLAGSATLARQIDAGAPADIFISANVDWMDWLKDQGHVVAEGRVNIASNALVLVTSDPAYAGSGEITDDTDLPAMLGEGGRLAIALPDSVPAGAYGKAALTTLGHWQDVSDRLAPTDNVRAALALVALGEAPLGVVYATDALAEPRVSVVAQFPEGSHPAIHYPAAVTSESAEQDAAHAFLEWLATDGQPVFARHGFLAPKAVE